MVLRFLLVSMMICSTFFISWVSAVQVGEYVPTEQDEQLAKKILNLSYSSYKLRTQINTLYSKTTNPRFKYLLAPAVYRKTSKKASFESLANLIQWERKIEFVCEVRDDTNEKKFEKHISTDTLDIWQTEDNPNTLENAGAYCEFGWSPHSVSLDAWIDSNTIQQDFSVPFDNVKTRISINQHDSWPNSQETKEDQIISQPYRERINFSMDMQPEDNTFGFAFKRPFQSPTIRKHYEWYRTECWSNIVTWNQELEIKTSQCISQLLLKDPVIKRIIQREYYNALDSYNIR